MASADIRRAPLPAHELSASVAELPILHSNRGSHIAPASTGWMLSTPRNTPVSKMRARFERDGYIWVKNVLPRSDVLDMRERYFSQLAPTGILRPGTSPRDGIFNPESDPLAFQGIGGTPVDQILQLLDSVHADPFYRAFLEHPALRSFVREFMGWETEVLVERAMLRHNVPGSLSTGIHYDKYFLRASPAPFLTAWVPLGDTVPTGGGLMYLSNSNDLGQRIERDFLAQASHLSESERIDAFNVFMNKDGFLSHDAAGFLEQYGIGERAEGVGEQMKWLVGDYEAGDVVFHTPCMVHAATRNEDVKGRIRLASDLRFYDGDVQADERWRAVWRHDDGL